MSAMRLSSPCIRNMRIFRPRIAQASKANQEVASLGSRRPAMKPRPPSRQEPFAGLISVRFDMPWTIRTSATGDRTSICQRRHTGMQYRQGHMYSHVSH
ncbi:hypothetical protein CF327_g2513 [Tilletia walkeri]|nr:hypothetical protein CF327_g2513 [Tilletia walkeri]